MKQQSDSPDSFRLAMLKAVNVPLNLLIKQINVWKGNILTTIFLTKQKNKILHCLNLNSDELDRFVNSLFVPTYPMVCLFYNHLWFGQDESSIHRVYAQRSPPSASSGFQCLWLPCKSCCKSPLYCISWLQIGICWPQSLCSVPVRCPANFTGEARGLSSVVLPIFHGH